MSCSEIISKKKKIIETDLGRYRMITLDGWASAFNRPRYILDQIRSGFYFEYLSLGLWFWRKRNRAKFHKYIREDKVLSEALFDFPKIELDSSLLIKDVKYNKNQPILNINKMRRNENLDFIVYVFLVNLSVFSCYNYVLFINADEGEAALDYKSLYFMIEEKIFNHFYATKLWAFNYGDISASDKKKEFFDLLKSTALTVPSFKNLELSNYITNRAEKEMFLFFIKYWISEGKILNFLFSTKHNFHLNIYGDDNFWEILLFLYKTIDNMELEGPGLSWWWKFFKTCEFVISTLIFKIFVNWHEMFLSVYNKLGRSIIKRMLDCVYEWLAKMLDAKGFIGQNDLLPSSKAWKW